MRKPESYTPCVVLFRLKVVASERVFREIIQRSSWPYVCLCVWALGLSVVVIWDPYVPPSLCACWAEIAAGVEGCSDHEQIRARQRRVASAPVSRLREIFLSSRVFFSHFEQFFLPRCNGTHVFVRVAQEFEAFFVVVFHRFQYVNQEAVLAGVGELVIQIEIMVDGARQGDDVLNRDTKN